MIKGYKAFNSNMTNRYGEKFEVGKTYHANGKIKWGNEGNGFHFCTYLEDCFRFFSSEDVLVAQVIGYGDMEQYDDDYYGYYFMYVSEYMDIVKLLTRDEIIQEMLCVNEDRKNRFIRDFKLTKEELRQFEESDSYGPNNCKGCKRKQLKKY